MLMEQSATVVVAYKYSWARGRVLPLCQGRCSVPSLPVVPGQWDFTKPSHLENMGRRLPCPEYSVFA